MFQNSVYMRCTRFHTFTEKTCEMLTGLVLTEGNSVTVFTHQTTRRELSHVDSSETRIFRRVESEISDSPDSEFHARRASSAALMPFTVWHSMTQDARAVWA